MTVEIPAQYVPFVQNVVQSGIYQSDSAVLGEALRLLQHLEELRSQAIAGVEQLDRGEMALLDVADTLTRGRQRLAARS